MGGRKLHFLRVAGSSGGCVAGIGLIAWLSALSGVTFLIPPFGASSVIVFVIPTSAYAQPRNVIGGHLVASLIGLAFYLCAGNAWWSLSLAVGLAALTMQLSGTLHPPAAADPLFFMMQGGLSWQAVVAPVAAGSLALVLFAYLYNNWVLKRPYPQHWF